MRQSSFVSRLVTPTLVFLVLLVCQLLTVKECDVTYLQATTTVQEVADSEEHDQHDGAGTVPRCIWSPKPVDSSYTGTSCMKTLTQVIQDLNPNATPPQRWMFFGDSTMGRLFTRSPLMAHFVNDARVNKACPGLYQCQTFKHARCNLDEKFGIDPVETWMPPNFTLGEGPEAYGATHPYCLDCSGCSSYYTLCNPQQTPYALPTQCVTSAYHGAYFSIEFARDVELQSQEYRTTQETIAAFLHQKFNSPVGNSSTHEQILGGKPVCVLSMGLHDMRIPGITLKLFGRNMHWFLELFSDQCSHIVWLPNAAPLQKAKGNYSQSEETIGKCNDAVADILPHVSGVTTSILDVWDASIGWPHDKKNTDNVHMNNEWYHALGSFLVELSKELIPSAPQDSGALQK